MKKIAITSLILILVPTLIFLPAYFALIYSTTTNAKDYKDIIQGEWTAYQYYQGPNRVACNDEIGMSVTVDGENLSIKGTVLPEAETKLTWLSGTSFSYTSQDKIVTFYLSLDEKENLKIVVDDNAYIIMLRKSEG